MAENTPNNKTGILAKAQRRLARTKTKVLQNLGKAERTTDDIVNDYVTKVDKQQETAQHLQKELKHYQHCVRNLCQASRSLHACLSQTYEEEWTDAPVFTEQLKSFDLMVSDYAENLQESTSSLQSYLQSFPILKNKVAKRGRKMVDFDNSRHHMEVLQGAKKRDEVKIQKAQEDLNDAKRIYEQLNNELHAELPEFYNSRVSFYATLFTSMFGIEFIFHSETGKIYGTLGDVSQKLAKEYEQFVYQPKVSLTKSVSTNSGGENGLNGDSPSTPSTPVVSSPSRDSSEPLYHNQATLDASQQSVQSLCVESKEKPSPTLGTNQEQGQKACTPHTAESKCSMFSVASSSSNISTVTERSKSGFFNNLKRKLSTKPKTYNTFPLQSTKTDGIEIDMATSTFTPQKSKCPEQLAATIIEEEQGVSLVSDHADRDKHSIMGMLEMGAENVDGSISTRNDEERLCDKGGTVQENRKHLGVSPRVVFDSSQDVYHARFFTGAASPSVLCRKNCEMARRQLPTIPPPPCPPPPLPSYQNKPPRHSPPPLPPRLIPQVSQEHKNLLDKDNSANTSKDNISKLSKDISSTMSKDESVKTSRDNSPKICEDDSAKISNYSCAKTPEYKNVESSRDSSEKSSKDIYTRKSEDKSIDSSAEMSQDYCIQSFKDDGNKSLTENVTEGSIVQENIKEHSNTQLVNKRTLPKLSSDNGLAINLQLLPNVKRTSCPGISWDNRGKVWLPEGTLNNVVGVNDSSLERFRSNSLGNISDCQTHVPNTQSYYQTAFINQPGLHDVSDQVSMSSSKCSATSLETPSTKETKALDLQSKGSLKNLLENHIKKKHKLFPTGDCEPLMTDVIRGSTCTNAEKNVSLVYTPANDTRNLLSNTKLQKSTFKEVLELNISRSVFQGKGKVEECKTDLEKIKSHAIFPHENLTTKNDDYILEPKNLKDSPSKEGPSAFNLCENKSLSSTLQQKMIHHHKVIEEAIGLDTKCPSINSIDSRIAEAHNFCSDQAQESHIVFSGKVADAHIACSGESKDGHVVFSEEAKDIQHIFGKTTLDKSKFHLVYSGGSKNDHVAHPGSPKDCHIAYSGGSNDTCCVGEEYSGESKDANIICPKEVKDADIISFIDARNALAISLGKTKDASKSPKSLRAASLSSNDNEDIISPSGSSKIKEMIIKSQREKLLEENEDEDSDMNDAQSVLAEPFGSHRGHEKTMTWNFGSLMDAFIPIPDSFHRLASQTITLMDRCVPSFNTFASRSSDGTPSELSDHEIGFSSGYLGSSVDSIDQVCKAKRESGGSQVNGDKKAEDTAGLDSSQDSPAMEKKHEESSPKMTTKHDDDEEGNVYEMPKDPSPTTANHKEEDEDETDNLYSGVPSNKPLYNAPPDAIYTVEATHKYQGEDEDELNFEAGEIIHVLEFDIPDEQDDGWQYGVKQSDGKKGVFPENFTRRVLE